MAASPPPDPGFDFDFRSRRPDGRLHRFVESIWYARGTVPYTREKIAPTGSTVAVIVLGDPILETPDNGDGAPLHADRGFLAGPHDRPVVNEPTGETFAVGIVTTVIGCGPVFGCRPTDLRGRVVDLTTAWPPAEALRRDLLALTRPDEMLDALEGCLQVEVEPPPPGTDRCEEVARMLEADPTRPVGEIAAAVGVSHGHLDAEFTRVVGLSPRRLARLLRMRRLLARVEGRPTVRWADLASEFGWYDQGHLIRDFKRHTGVTPSEYLDAQATAYAHQEGGAGFTPEF